MSVRFWLYRTKRRGLKAKEILGLNASWLRWAWRAFWQPDYQLPASVRTSTGALWYLSDPVDDFIAMDLLRRHEIHFPPHFEIPQYALLLDIGAHSGLWAVEALHLWPGANVIAVEPNPTAIQNLSVQLLHNELFSRCTIIPAAIANTWAAMSKLYLASSGSWGNTTFEIAGNAAVEVPTVTLDMILCGRVPTLIKCNAEGAEFNVINQLVSSSIRPKYLLLALHPEYGDVDQAVFQLRNEGYQMTLIDHPGNKKRPFYHCELSPGTSAEASHE